MSVRHVRSCFRRLGVIAASLAAFAGAGAFAEETYPSKPIRLVVPTAAGGASDVVARLLAQKLGDALGTTVVVENRAGSGNIIGTAYVAKAAPDGYTLLMTYTDHVFNPFLHADLTFDPLADFSGVAFIGTVPLLLVANNGLKADNVGELISLARSQPGKLNFSSAGSGSSLHLAGELFKSMAHIDVVHVPYKGGPPAHVAVLANEVQFEFPTLYSVEQAVRAGQVKALAVTSAQRSAQFPNVPTVAESGLPGYEAGIWYGIVAPAKTPTAVIALLNREINKALSSPDLSSKLKNQGFALEPATPQVFDERIRRDSVRWSKVIRDANIKLE